MGVVNQRKRKTVTKKRRRKSKRKNKKMPLRSKTDCGKCCSVKEQNSSQIREVGARGCVVDMWLPYIRGEGNTGVNLFRRTGTDVWLPLMSIAYRRAARCAEAC